MLRKILVYEDSLADHHPALERAIQLADGGRLDLKVIDVVDGPANALRELQRPLRDLVEQERKDCLDSICQPLRARKIGFQTELIRGRPFIEIVREVVHERFHLVIKTASHATPTKTGGLLGPVDLRLVRNCPCPVWLEPRSPATQSLDGANNGQAPDESQVERKPQTKASVLVAIDPQAEDEDLNGALLRMGESLAETFHADLEIVSAWEIPDEDFLVEKMNEDVLKRYAQMLQSAAQKQLDELLVNAGKPANANNVHFSKGRPADVILKRIAKRKPDLLVIGTVGGTNVSGLLIGNTTDAVLRQVDCSVLAVKPKTLFRV